MICRRHLRAGGIYQPSRRRDLETLWLVCDHQGRKASTVGGMIQAGRFGRSDKSRILDRIEIHSCRLSITGWRSTIPVCCPWASRWRLFTMACPSCVIV
jgi:hypothetical protein